MKTESKPLFSTLSKLIVSICLLCLGISYASASNRDADDRRENFMKELRDYKHKFMARDLSLTKDQQKAFFPLYDEMEDETIRLNDETRELERKILEATNEPSDLEYEKAAEALYDLKIKEGEIEKSYMIRFASILTKKQLFMIKNSERNFVRDLVAQQQRLRQKSAAQTQN